MQKKDSGKSSRRTLSQAFSSSSVMDAMLSSLSRTSGLRHGLNRKTLDTSSNVWSPELSIGMMFFFSLSFRIALLENLMNLGALSVVPAIRVVLERGPIAV